LSRWKILSVGITGIWLLSPLAVLALSVSYWSFGAVAAAFVLASAIAFFLLERALHVEGVHSIDILKRKLGEGERLCAFLEGTVEPRFYETAALPFTPILAERFEAIQKEVLALVDAQPEKLAHAYNNAWMFTGAHWTARNLVGWGLHNDLELPVTRAAMRAVGAINCNISRLAPHSVIEPHFGESNAYIRCHLPLRVRGASPELGLVVGGEQRSWKEGELMAFTDLHQHSAFNHSDRERLVLIFDVMRPDCEDLRELLCCRWLASYSFLAISNAVAAVFGRLAGALPLRVWGHSPIGPSCHCGCCCGSTSALSPGLPLPGSVSSKGPRSTSDIHAWRFHGTCI
jgi:ornithine lipid ester-linked acyl 2-hydroxylase